MNSKVWESSACLWLFAALFGLFGHIAPLQAEEAETEKLQSAELQPEESKKPQYPETIAVLQMLYGGEVRARYRYLEFAKVAKADGHENIAYLFKAIAHSEAVHEKNFSRILESLGTKAATVDLSSIKIETTKENLKYATEVELSEIDTEYPRYIHRVSPEKHLVALEYINYAWEAERQHRELIKEIQSGTGMFFSMLLEHFRKNDSTYYVNQNCGATVTELPLDRCPICHKPLDTYIVVPAP
ncbi:rubrerythrin [Mariprofundus micogutta]|uniref:Rubrerythrin n=1 Tax=Mariprofundus micogutta TaxID=1921010 RepID=A0A1L8CMZ7_9PROT|nr:rubrerythrin family protein [Mariprofundus micogutta]GAV20199.1 rubrerythrin [Mariprofundus micogutta]